MAFGVSVALNAIFTASGPPIAGTVLPYHCALSKDAVLHVMCKLFLVQLIARNFAETQRCERFHTTQFVVRRVHEVDRNIASNFARNASL